MGHFYSHFIYNVVSTLDLSYVHFPVCNTIASVVYLHEEVKNFECGLPLREGEPINLEL